MRGQGNNQRHSHDSRVYIYSEHVPDRMLQRVDHLLMIRDRRYKLVEYVGWWKAPAAGNVVGDSVEHDIARASPIT